MISRYFNICFSYQSFHCKLQNFKQIFSLNGYPISLIDNCIRTFLDKIFSPKLLVHSCSKKILFFCIPYTGQHGLQIRTQLHKFLSKAYPHISICFVFRPTCRLFDFFHSRTEFLLLWDRILCINISVNAVAIVCWSNTPTYSYTRESQNIWEFRPKLEISFQSHKCECLLFWRTIISPNILYHFWLWLYNTNIR